MTVVVTDFSVVAVGLSLLPGLREQFDHKITNYSLNIKNQDFTLYNRDH